MKRRGTPFFYNVVMAPSRWNRFFLLSGLLFVFPPFAYPLPQADPGQTARSQALLAEVQQAERAQDFDRASAAYEELTKLRPADAALARGLGLARYLQGQYEEAIPPLEKAVALDPNLAGARLYLGISYYRTNRFTEAVEALRQAPELDDRTHLGHYWLAASYRAAGQLGPAIEALKTARQKAPADLEVLDLLARSYAEHAAEILNRLLAVAPDSGPAGLLRAEDLAGEGVTEVAIKELDAALASSPLLLGAHLLKGQLLWNQGKFEEGAEEFRAELRNDPLNLEAHYRLGAFYLDNGQAEKALEHLRLAAKYRRNDSMLATMLEKANKQAAGAETGGAVAGRPEGLAIGDAALAPAWRAYAQGEAAEAATMLESLGAPSIAAWRLLLRCYLAEGRMERTLDALHTILSEAADDPEALYVLGKTYEQLSAETAEKLFALHPESYRARLLRGEAFERGPRYEFEKALAEFLKARELQPDSAGVNYAVGRVFSKMNRFDEALPYLAKELSLNANHGLANYQVGRIYLSRGERAKAIPYLRAAIRAQPDLFEAQRSLGQALVGEGQYEEGISAYEQLLTKQPNDASVYALLAVAYRTAGKMDKAKRSAEKARLLQAAKNQPREETR